MSHNITKADGLAWRKARASVGQGACVELAPMPSGDIALRDSKFPGAAPKVFTKPEIAAFLIGARNGEFDDLVV